MHKFALLNASRAATLAAAGKVVYFFPYFFLLIPGLVDAILTRTLPALHLLLHVRMQLRKLVRFIVMLLYIHPTQQLSSYSSHCPNLDTSY